MVTREPLLEEEGWLDSRTSGNLQSWSAYHAMNDRRESERHSTNVAVLPLFKESASSPAMMMHSMNIVIDAARFINPNQIPVLVADQPLFALLKQLRYVNPETHGEDKLFVMMSSLHIEIVSLKAAGKYLKDSGWIYALIQADVTTTGRADAMVAAYHVTRARYGHQVTAFTLYSLQKKAYNCYFDETNDVSEEKLNFYE